MAAPQDFTIEDLLADAQSSGASPLDTAAGLRKWRDDMASYGRGKHDAEKYWEGIRRLDNDLAPVLENLRDQEANRILGQLGENRPLFLAQYNKAQGNPDEMAPAFADHARSLNALSESKDFSPERVGFASLTTDDGKPLADVVVGRGEALVRPLTGGSAFLVPVDKRTPEEITKLAEKYKADADLFNQAAEVDTLPITPGSFASQEAMQSYLKTRARQEQLKADAYATGDPTVIAGFDVGAAIKGQPELLSKIADKDLMDRFQSGLLKASINTARALDDLDNVVYGNRPQDRFAGFEEALAQTNTDTARSFQATTGDTVAASATESLGQMAPTVIPYTATARLGGLAVREGLAAATMAPASYGQELASMLESAKQAEAAGDPAKANQLRSVARWSAFTQAAIDTGTEMMFPELAGAAIGGKGALKRMLTAPLKEGLEEVAAGGLERGVKQPAFYPTDMQQPVVEGMLTEGLAGLVAGGTMSTVQEGGAAVANSLQKRGEALDEAERQGFKGNDAIVQADKIYRARKTEAKKAAAATGDPGTAAAVEEVFDLAQDFATLDSPPATEPPPAQAVVERDSMPEPAVLPPPESVAPGQVERTAEVAPPVEEPGALDAAAPPTAVEEPGAPAVAAVEEPGAPAVAAVEEPPTPVLPEDDSNVGVEAPADPTASPPGEPITTTPPGTVDPTTEGSVPGGVNDLGASTEGPATGSSAPAVSVTQQTPTQETVNVDLPHLRSLASSPTIGTNALRHELSYYSPQEREWIARQLGAPDPSPNTLAQMLRYQENGNERFTLTPDRPTANMTEAQARAALGNVPKNVTFINDPEARTPWGTPWAGKANRGTGEVTLNLANITDAADLRSRLNEELAHIVWQDPAVQEAVRTLEAAVTPAMRAEMSRMGYDAAALTEEAAARLVDKLGRNPDTRSAWRKFLDAVRNALRRLLRLEPTQRQVEQAAREILTYAMSERGAQGSGEMFSAVDPREQVFGNRNVGATKPVRSFAESMRVAKETYFDSSLPISESTTATAHRLAAEWADRHTGAQVAAGLLRAANGDELVIGAAQGELHNYAIKLAGTGDASLLNFLQATVARWAVVEGGEGTSSIAALLAGRRPYSQSAFMEAVAQVGTGRRAAETTVLSPEVVDGVTTAVTSTKLGKADVRRVKRAKKDAKGETLEDKVERTIADKSAEQVLNKFATSQSDTLSWLPKGKTDAVRALIRAALETGSKVKQWDKQWLVQSLVDLEVTPEIAVRLADTTWEERRRRFDILSNERREKEAQTVAQKMADLATGERGSLSGLEDALLDAPAAQQQDPGWRRATARAYFSQLGLSPQQAAAAARIYDAEFAERLGDALVAAVERVASQQAPWQEKLQKLGPKQLKKVQTDMDRLRRAVRVGVTHPDTPWHTALAKAHGWKGFTREQNMRLHEIDAQLARHDVLDHEKKRLLNEMQDIVVRANLPPKLADYLAAEYTLSALSGLPTAFVQLSAVFSILRDFFSDVMTSPVVSARSLLASMDSFIGNLSYAGRTDVYNHQVAEHLRGAMPAMRYLLEQGLENLQSDNPATKAKGIMQVIVGGLHFVGRFLSAMDEGSIAAAEIYKTSMFTNRALKRLGWTREQAGAVILASLDARAEALAEAKQNGYKGDEATVLADGIFRRRIHEGMSMADRNIADDIVRGAASEAIGMVGRLNAKTAATDIGSLGIDAEAVGNMDEGMLSRYTVNPILDSLQKLHSKGGIAALAARLAFGFVSVPFRAARWYSSYSPYGFVRYAMHKHRVASGNDTLWKQSFGTRAQEQQRLRDAIVGTLAQVAAVLLRSNSGDDDPEKSEIKFIVTGKGPVDAAQRMAWSRRFKPYTMYVKMGRTYVPFNMGRLGESVAWSFGLAGALDDVALTKKGRLARNPGLAFRDSAELFGSYYGSLSQRASFQSIGRLFSSANRGGAAQLGDEMFKQVAFAGSTFIPWKGALGSLTRMASEPVDQNTMSGVIWSNTPVVGPLFGRPALNPLGDPIGDQTLAGKLYREGFPLIVRFPTDGRDSRVYELILDQGFGPSDPRRYDLERRVGPVTPQQFYEYSRARGQYIKAKMDEQYQSLKRMSPEQYGSYIRRISENANAQAARVIR